ncbi:hypothetical protein L798_09976 [Zootermopsis nevadensis]|uniref:Uncharacterized protein n=1 Tax=Zootermopsis nevadensis TaxID=136037 RepID=A0A067RBI5_ZOONE|nr:hypothetical protein L798_09976 [Zootermopsis nevadensis]
MEEKCLPLEHDSKQCDVEQLPRPFLPARGLSLLRYLEPCSDPCPRVCAISHLTTLRTTLYTSSKGTVVLSGRKNSMAWQAASSSMAITFSTF